MKQSFLSRIKSRVHKNVNSDKGDANVITSMLIIPFVFFLIVSAIDIGMFFNNKMLIANAARDGARTTGIIGGTGDKENMTALEKSYAGSMTKDEVTNCRTLKESSEEDPDENSFIFTASNSMECLVAKEIGASNSFRLDINNVTCGPKTTSHIGERAYCEVDYTYNGLPASFFSILAGEQQTVTESSAAEVIYDKSLVLRSW